MESIHQDNIIVGEIFYGRDVFNGVMELIFGRSTKNLGSFLSQAWVDGVLRWRANDVVEGTYHPIHHR